MRLLLTILLSLFLNATIFPSPLVEYHKRLLLMGCSFEFTVIHEDSSLCKTALTTAIQEVERIENLVSSWKHTSETSRINQKASTDSIKIDNELYQLIARSKKVSQLTKEAFSICFASVYHLYNFERDTIDFPSIDSLQHYRKLTSSNNIFLKENNFIQLSAFSKISFGAIAKGYAADRVKAKLISLGIKNACINASGDLTVWGKNIDGKAWNIGITNPQNKETILLQLPLDNNSIVTSGDYENYFLTKDGEHHSHIIDPRTCLPVTNRLSVSVISSSTEFSDALATAICVMGIEEGLALVNKLKRVEAIIIDQNHEVYYSRHIMH